MNAPALPIAAVELVPHRPPMLLVDSLLARDRDADTGAGIAHLPTGGIFVTGGAVLPEYFIEVGMYDAATGQRLPIFDEDGARLPGDRILLDQVITVR